LVIARASAASFRQDLSFAGAVSLGVRLQLVLLFHLTKATSVVQLQLRQ
jgi:hypothetical protein